VVTRIGETELKGWDQAKYTEALKAAGYTASADKSRINYPMALFILWIMVVYVTMAYGPIAAFLVEMFPTKIRYTSMSLPTTSAMRRHAAPPATAMVAKAGNIYQGLWYPIVVSLMTVVVGLFFLRETKERSIMD